MFEKEEYDAREIEKNILSPEDILETDLKINPDFYLHYALLNAQKCLGQENAEQGFLQFWGYIEHIEILCDAAKIIPNDYQKKIEEFKQTDEYKNTEKSIVKNFKVANFKLKLLMTEVFSRKTVTAPLKSVTFN